MLCGAVVRGAVGVVLLCVACAVHRARISSARARGVRGGRPSRERRRDHDFLSASLSRAQRQPLARAHSFAWPARPPRHAGLARAQLHDHALARQADELAERYALEADALTLAEQASHEASRLAESAQRLARLAALRAEVEGLDAAYAFDSEYKSRAHAVHRLSAALFGLDGALRGGAAADSLSTSLAALKAAAPADELVRAALASLPPAVVSAERVQSCRELQVRFETVLSQGRVAAFVPEGSGIFGQLVGAFVALIAFKERGLVPPVDAAAIFARAEHYVHREQLGEVRGRPSADRARDRQARARARRTPTPTTSPCNLCLRPRVCRARAGGGGAGDAARAAAHSRAGLDGRRERARRARAGAHAAARAHHHARVRARLSASARARVGRTSARSPLGLLANERRRP